MLRFDNENNAINVPLAFKLVLSGSLCNNLCDSEVLLFS